MNCQEYLSLTISRNLIGQQLCHHRIRARQDPALGDRMVIRRGASSRCASGFRLSAVGLLTNLSYEQEFARIPNPALQSIMPPKNTLKQPFPTCNSRDELWEETLRVLSSVEGSSITDETTSTQLCLLLSTTGNTWSRAARRKKHTTPSEPGIHEPTSQLLCRIQCTDNTSGIAGTGGFQLEFHWIRGCDRALFESFMSHVARKIGTAVKAVDVDMA